MKVRSCLFTLLQLGTMFLIIIAVIGVIILWALRQNEDDWLSFLENLETPPARSAIIAPQATPASYKVSPNEEETSPQLIASPEIPLFKTEPLQTSTTPTIGPDSIIEPSEEELTPKDQAPRPSPQVRTEPQAVQLDPPAEILPADITLRGPVTAATRIVIPALNLDTTVVAAPIKDDTWDVSHLRQDVGHLAGTASLGSQSNVVLAAHVTLAPNGGPGPFKDLESLQTGEAVILYHDEESFIYRINSLYSVKPDQVEVTYPSTEAELTLITCLNYDPQSGKYEDRLVAKGYLVPLESTE